MNKPKVLFLDIETCPLEVHTWGIRDQYVNPDQIIKDWTALSWTAKWLGDPKLIYEDCRNKKDPRNDKDVVKGVWKLLNQADFVVAHNGRAFDCKKLNARFVNHGLAPTSPYQVIDTLSIARKRFAFTSNKLEYLAKFLGVGAKSKHNKFPGLEMWKECLLKNPLAWSEMEKYNKQDVVVLEKVYDKLIPWDSSINFNSYNLRDTCTCGSTGFRREGFRLTALGKYQSYRCVVCGKYSQGRENLLTKSRRQAMRKGA